MKTNWPLKHISRIDNKYTHCWFVRISYKNKMYRKSFSDKICGGKNSALLCAISWRDSTLKKLNKMLSPQHVFTRSKSNTGHIGINEKLIVEKKIIKGKVHTYKYKVFEYTWNTPEGKIKRSRISINKYGEKRALSMAIKNRQEKLREMMVKAIEKQGEYL